MKLLFDQNLSFKLCERLADLFPDSNQVRRLKLDSADDRTLWQFAKTNGFTIVSQDSDFADMAALFGPPPKVIWLRCGNQPTAVIEKLFRDHAEAIVAFEQDANAACWEIY
jgi:predicted nuclease of predicted toxin-antitoxin system